MKNIMIIAIALSPALAFADGPSYLDGVLAWISSVSQVSLSLVLGIVAEIGMRIFKSEKALSLLIPVKYLLASLIKVMEFLIKGLDILIENFNRVQPPQA